MYDSEGTFNGRLLPGERLRWTGAPMRGLLFTSRDWTIIPFSLIWIGICCYILFFAAPAKGNAPGAFNFIAPLFLAIGVYMLAGRFVVDIWARSLTRYAVTDQRVIISRGAPFTKFTAIDIDKITQMDIKEEMGGLGTIMFGPEIVVYGRRGRRSVQASPSFDPTPQFLAIENARMVFDMIQRESTKDT